MSAFLGSALQKLDQLAAPDDINTGRDRIVIGYDRFLFEFFDPAFIIHADHAKTLYFTLVLTCRTYNSDVCTFRNMEIQNLVVIHLVDAVAGCDHDIRLMAFLEEINVLVNCICCSLIPQAVVLGDRRGKYKKSSLLTAEVPPFGGT